MADIIAAQIAKLKNTVSGRWAERILSQTEYAEKLSRVNNGKYDKILEGVVDYLTQAVSKEEVITKAVALNAEEMLMGLSGDAKAISMICAAHAHIDMNWMWGYDETVAVTLGTFRTMLNLMEEYPDFKFSQSQGSVYRIVEEYDPEMLEEIKVRVKEGRWEVTASTWVETDKNMPNGESLARHILHTKRTLSEMLDLDPDSLGLDLEPDTFGHSLNTPELLSKGGVKYYYHCRGYDGHNLFRWQSPSGSSVIVYREPLWYNSAIDAYIGAHLPEFCNEHGVDTVLKVYGVGDHGGGPTRRDIERLLEMSQWPIFPSIRFGTFAEFFAIMEKVADSFPVVEHELNFVFTGCYTSQSRIKLANRISEAKLNEAETFSSISSVFARGKYPTNAYRKSWERVLFSHFHDILTGSCVIEAKEHAMGEFQHVLAAANTGIGKAMDNISSKINTLGLVLAEDDLQDTVSEGAGVGHVLCDYGVPQVERGRGNSRIYHFFNPSLQERSGPVEIALWDWPGDVRRIEIRDMDGNNVDYQVLVGKMRQWQGSGVYWGHTYMRLLIDARVPGAGYSTYLLHESEVLKTDGLPDLERSYDRVNVPDEFILENDKIKAVFDTRDASIISLTDKATGDNMVDPGRPAGVFRLIEEDDVEGMTSWVIGRYMKVLNLNNGVKELTSHIDRHTLRQWIEYRISFGNSNLKVQISLDYNSKMLDYQVECEWHELAVRGKYIPQLNFHMPFAYACGEYKYDIPFGTIIRDDMDMDVPANSWAVGMPENEGKNAVMLITDTKYGFRGTDNSIALSLIRSSYDPDLCPESGVHRFKFAVAIADDAKNNRGLIEKAYSYNHRIIFTSGRKHDGILPLENSFMSYIGGSVAVSTVKMPEDNTGKGQMLLRVYETEGDMTKAVFKFARNAVKAWYTDINECKQENDGGIEIDGDTVSFRVEPYSIANVVIEF